MGAVRPRDGVVVGVLAVGAILAGSVQNLAVSYTQSPLASLIDDAMVGLLVVAALARLHRAKAGPVMLLMLYCALVLLALLRTGDEGILDSSDTAVLARQVVMPGALILVGIVMNAREFLIVARAAVLVAITNCVYIAVELVFGFPVPPAMLSDYHGVYNERGIPGYYLGLWFDGTPFVRAGGYFLNPPTVGIVIAIGAILVFFLWRTNWRLPVVAGMVVCLALTGSRAGMLIAFVAMVIPVVARRLGSLPALAIATVPIVLVGAELMNLGGAGAHVIGLTGGLTDALLYPFGRGFGFVGNHADVLGLAEYSESLAGIAFSAGGVVVVALVALLALRLLLDFLQDNCRWLPLVGLGGIGAALLSETAGSINATVPLWMIVGFSIGGAAYPLYERARVAFATSGRSSSASLRRAAGGTSRR